METVPAAKIDFDISGAPIVLDHPQQLPDTRCQKLLRAECDSWREKAEESTGEASQSQQLFQVDFHIVPKRACEENSDAHLHPALL
jgi:hypothetical protein